MNGQTNGHQGQNGGEQRRTPEQEFAARVHRTAMRQLASILSTEDGKKAAHAITMAMLSAMRTARNPSAFLEVTEASIADCVATSYETGLHPGGPNPVVYLVPQAPRKGAQPELQWRITHRGLSILAARAGYGVLAVPVSSRDHVEVAFGEVVAHRADPAAWPSGLDEIVGCILVVRRISDGVTISRAWMPRQAITQRKQMSRDGGTWSSWPIEMAQKTVIKWGFSRGYVPLDSPELRAAMEADSRGEVIDTTAVTVETEQMGGAAALGGRRQAAALPDHGEGRDFRAEADALASRERVVAGHAERVEEEPPPPDEAPRSRGRSAPAPDDDMP